MAALGSHHANKLAPLLPTQSLERGSGSGVQQGSTPRWIGGHGTEPYEQKTQHEPGSGFNLAPHLLQS
jgi:hypothetical protein